MLEQLIAPALNIIVLVLIGAFLLFLFGGNKMRVMLIGVTFKVITGLIGIVVKLGLLVIRRVFNISKDYTKDENNKDVVQNVTGGIIFIACAIYLAKTPGVLMGVARFEHDGWMFLGAVGLLAFMGEGIVRQAPYLRSSVFLREWGYVIVKFVTGITGISGVIHLILSFYHASFPKMSLTIAFGVLVTYLVYLCNHLLNNDESNLHQRTLNKLHSIKEGGNFEKGPADLIVAYQKATSTGAIHPIVVPEISRYQHLHVIGPTGTGKSILASYLAVQDLMNPGVGVIALEPTKDFVRNLSNICIKTGRKYYYIDPTDSNTAVINPLDGDDWDEVAEINVGAFKGYLGPDYDTYYKGRQSQALRMGVKVAKAMKGDEATYDDVTEILRPNKDSFLMREYIIKQLKEKDDLYDIRKDLEEYHQEFSDPKTSHQARQGYNGLYDYLRELTSNRYMRRVLCQKSTVSLREIFMNGDVLLITTAYGKLKETGFVLGRLMITMLQSETFYRTELEEDVRDKLPPTAVYVDEVQNYVSEPFAEIFEMARKAKMMMHIFHQGLAQLRKISDRLEQTIFDNARQKVIFGGTNIQDCKMISERIGEEWVNVKSTSQGMFDPLSINRSSSDQLRLRMTPSEIATLPGFNTETFAPAEVLLLLTIHNVIKPAQIGLVGPLPREIFKEQEMMEMPLDPSEEENEDQYEEETDNEEQQTETNIPEEGKITDQEEEGKENQEDLDVENTQETDINKKRKRRRKRGKRSTGNDLVEKDEDIEDDEIIPLSESTIETLGDDDDIYAEMDKLLGVEKKKEKEEEKEEDDLPMGIS